MTAGLGARIHEIDAAAARAIGSLLGRWPPLDAGMAAAARYLAGAEILLLAALFVGGIDHRSRNRRGAALRTVPALGATVVSVELIRLAVERPRPFASSQTGPLVPHSPHRSFPSKHAACAAAMATVARPVAPAIGRLMAVLGALLSVGRLYAGLHYPSDVIVGWLIGTLVGRLARGGRYT